MIPENVRFNLKQIDVDLFQIKTNGWQPLGHDGKVTRQDAR